MSRMSGNDKSPSRDFGGSLQLTNYILDSGEMCHMTPQVSNFIPGSLEDTDKHFEIVYVHHITAKQKVQVQIKMCDNNVNLFIMTLHNVLLAPYLCYRLFSIIRLMNLLHTCLFCREFLMVYFGHKEKTRLLYHIVHSRNMPFGGNKVKIK